VDDVQVSASLPGSDLAQVTEVWSGDPVIYSSELCIVRVRIFYGACFTCGMNSKGLAISQALRDPLSECGRIDARDQNPASTLTNPRRLPHPLGGIPLDVFGSPGPLYPRYCRSSQVQAMIVLTVACFGPNHVHHIPQLP
jgi:hypothetical protein